MLYICHKNKLAQFRKKAGLTQKELAKELGVAQSSITYWENGERTPSAKSAQKIANYFNVPLEEIFEPYKEEFSLSKIINTVSTSSELFDSFRQLEAFLNEKKFTVQEFKDLKEYAEFLISRRNKIVHGIEDKDDSE